MKIERCPQRRRGGSDGVAACVQEFCILPLHVYRFSLVGVGCVCVGRAPVLDPPPAREGTPRQPPRVPSQGGAFVAKVVRPRGSFWKDR